MRDAQRPLHKRVSFWFVAAVVGAFVFTAALPQAVVWASPGEHDPHACSIRDADGTYRDMLPPSAEHWFGTDAQGCDYFAQVVYGARVSLLAGVGAVAVATLTGLVMGGIAGFGAPWVDALISRTADVFFGLPLVLGAILLLAVLGGEQRSLWLIVVVMGVLTWPLSMRIFRASVLQVRAEPYVDAARVVGASSARIVVAHVTPNAISPLAVWATVSIGLFVAAEAALSFLGIGLQAPAISWGLQVAVAQKHLADTPHLLLFPGVALTVVISALLLLGDLMRDALDPGRR